MRVVAQRVASASVEVNHKVTGTIGPGLLVLAGFQAGDDEKDIVWMSNKLSHLRIFNDKNGVMNCSVIDTGGDVLVVSQFTLFASVKKGKRPSWNRAAPPDIAQPLFERFVQQLEANLNRSVPTGVFGADMKVHLVNEGPVTLLIDSAERL